MLSVTGFLSSRSFDYDEESAPAGCGAWLRNPLRTGDSTLAAKSSWKRFSFSALPRARECLPPLSGGSAKPFYDCSEASGAPTLLACRSASDHTYFDQGPPSPPEGWADAVALNTRTESVSPQRLGSDLAPLRIAARIHEDGCTRSAMLRTFHSVQCWGRSAHHGTAGYGAGCHAGTPPNAGLAAHVEIDQPARE